MSELVKALVKARMASKAVIRKEGKNSAQGYAYVGHEHVLVSGAREAMLSNGLTLVQTCVQFAGELDVPRDRGVMKVWRWKGEFELCHESGESKRYEFEATTQANDKAAFVASTALDRTALLRICQMSGGAKEDPEHDSNDRYEDAAEKTRRVARTLDDIAKEGAVYDPTAVDPRGPKPNERGGAVGKPLAESLHAIVDKLEPAQTDAGKSAETTGGELRDARAYRARYEAVVQEAIDMGAPFVGEDEYGLPVSGFDVPVFSKRAQKFAGKSYKDVPAGFLRDVILEDPKFQEATLAQRLWALYTVTVHETQKEKTT